MALMTDHRRRVGLRRERTHASAQFADGTFRNPSGLGPGLSGPSLPVIGEFLFHRAAERLAPLANRIVERIRQSAIVFADETSIKMLEGDTRAFVWTFLRIDPVAYLTDVLVRLDTPPNHKVDELLPDRWRPPDPAPSD